MNLTQLRLILQQPLPLLIAKAKTIVIEKIEGLYWDAKYTNSEFRVADNQLQIEQNIVSLNSIDVSTLDVEVAEYLTNMYLAHRFDLLGTGWVKNSYHSESLGLEGIKFENKLSNLIIDKKGSWLAGIVAEAHHKVSKQIWDDILQTNKRYTPIDWQKDYKVGFRFAANKSYKKQLSLMTSDGIDLKIPWELSRLQHLPQLAIFAKLLPLRKNEIIVEYKNQVLDFIMTNAPGMGVNWYCTMDVGIRVANMLLANDLFTQLDENNVLDKPFRKLFSDYIYAHGKHIVNNFEFREGLTSNHYLGNIAGLSFVSTYLNGGKEVGKWLLLSLQELKNELPKQFFNDGGNFEGSSAYHRLSGEMFLYSTAILNKISKEKIIDLKNIKPTKGIKQPYLLANASEFDFKENVFDGEYYTLLAKTTELSLAYRKSNGNITQIGDNDSGRFFRLSPCGEFLPLEEALGKYENLSPKSDYKEEKYWDENDINHDTFIAAISGFSNGNLLAFGEAYSVEKSIITQLVKTKITRESPINKEINKEVKALEFSKKTEFSFKEEASLLKNINHFYFPDFGMITIKSDLLYLNLTFGNNQKSHHSWGHHHNDKLSVEINVGGKDFVFDPGTYIYTPLPEKRNLFRGTKSHSSIVLGEEQNSFNIGKNGLFSIKREVKVEVLKLSKECIILSAKYRGTHHIRQVDVFEKSVRITDFCNKKFEQNFNNKLLSNGYGKLVYN